MDPHHWLFLAVRTMKMTMKATADNTRNGFLPNEENAMRNDSLSIE